MTNDRSRHKQGLSSNSSLVPRSSSKFRAFRENLNRAVQQYPMDRKKLRMENGAEVEVVPTSWLPNQQEATIYLAYSPSVIFRSGNPITRLAVQDLELFELRIAPANVMEIAPWLLRIEPVPNLLGLERTLRSNSGYAVTHTGTVRTTRRSGIFSGRSGIRLECVR